MIPRTRVARKFISSVAQIRNYSAPADRSIPAAKQKYVPKSGTYPRGFLAGSAFAGVKASNTKYDDLALIVSEEPCPANAIFTRNIFKAAPVTVSKAMLVEASKLPPEDQVFRGVIVNSGCANAVTGAQGKEHALAMSRATDKEFDSGKDDKPSTLVMSTGVIGQRLPIGKITAAIPNLKSNLGATHEHWLNAANAICTTDTFPKLISRTFTLPSHPDTTYSIAGMAKGAGMIHPNMATLLAIVCTDVKLEPTSMRHLLRAVADPSFNSISVDGDTSTNDTLALFANGAAAPPDAAALVYANTRLAKDFQLSEDALAFKEVLKGFLQDLAKLVVRDGEGATKFVTIRVKSDVSMRTAKRVAVSIARSALVKTALYGKDANWGRILCAIGYSPGIMNSFEVPYNGIKANVRPEAEQKSTRIIRQVDPERTSVSFIPADGSKELKLLVRGEPQEVDEARAKQILEMEDLEILVRLEDGRGAQSDGKIREAVYWTCDLSHEYVTINGDYRT